jgi:hypothetical protein
MSATVFPKDPDATLDYQVDWTTYLTPLADTISTSTWIVQTGITKGSDYKTATATTVWLSGGALGTRYKLINRIVTVGGRTDDRTFYVKVMDR